MKATRTPVIALLAAALAVPVFAGCSNDEESATADSAEPVTLRIGSDDEPGKPAADQIEELARRVSKLSGGDDPDQAGLACRRRRPRLGPARGADGQRAASSTWA